MTAIAIKLGVRFLVFGAAFGFAVWKNEKVTVKPRYAIPLVALVFALLNTAMYWALKPVLNVATLGMLGFVMPFLLNGFFLWATDRVLKPLKIDGLLTMAWLAGLLTIAHGALYLLLDVIIKL
jgi:uncharacterized membrane protein YvlD (DUF360 family)